MAIPGPQQRIPRWTPFLTRIAMGLQPGMEAFNAYGRNADISAAATEDIWTVGGDIVFPPTAETLSIASSDAVDNGVTPNTGAHTLLIEGLDADWMAITRIVTLDGEDAVLTLDEFLRVNLLHVIEVGTGGVNAGAITATQSVSGIVMGRVAIGQGLAATAAFTPPADKDFMLCRAWASIGQKQTSSLTAQLVAQPFGESLQVIHPLDGNSAGTSFVEIVFDIPRHFPAKTDLHMHAAVSGNGVDINGGFCGFLFETNRFVIGD